MRRLSRLAYRPIEAAEVVGLSRTTLYVAIRKRELRTSKVGRRRVITDVALREWLERKQATEAR
ncbi:MAG: helix-turn-helix domain-containing protein [Acidobacteriales bacterium]|nr:helix-turn-helix domain-containing protein [Terriglobales bacterium]